MARTKVSGVKIGDQVLPIEEERWGFFGPAMSGWVTKWVYWVLPIGTLLLTLLVLKACGVGFTKQTSAPPAPQQPVVSQPAPPRVIYRTVPQATPRYISPPCQRPVAPQPTPQPVQQAYPAGDPRNGMTPEQIQIYEGWYKKNE